MPELADLYTEVRLTFAKVSMDKPIQFFKFSTQFVMQ